MAIKLINIQSQDLMFQFQIIHLRARRIPLEGQYCEVVQAYQMRIFQTGFFCQDFLLFSLPPILHLVFSDRIWHDIHLISSVQVPLDQLLLLLIDACKSWCEKLSLIYFKAS